MNWITLKYPVYFGVLLMTLVLGCRKWKELQTADKVLASLIAITILQEIIAYFSYKIIKNNMYTYHFYSPIELFLICYYFNERSRFLKKRNIGLIIGGVGIVVSLANTIYLQPLKIFNSYYLLFEGAAIILLCLLSLSDILLNELIDFKKQSFFWITLALLFYWSTTYTGWGIFGMLDMRKSGLLKILEIVLFFSNLSFYGVISMVFINYKKLTPSVT